MQKTERQSNFEMMRIISMFFIVIYHMLIPTGGQLITYTTGLTKIFFELLSLIIIVHVNSFVLLTGYFQYDKKFKVKKVISLVGMAWIYGCLIALVFAIKGWHDFSLLDTIKVLSPFEYQNLWFLRTYIALYILSPYLNLLIKKLNRNEHKKLIMILFFMFCIISTITNQNTFNNNGYTLMNFIFLYILGSYLKKYPISKTNIVSKYSKKKQAIIYFSVFIILGIVNFSLYKVCILIQKNNPGEFISYVLQAICDNLYFYQNPFLIIQSVCYFLLFETFDFKSKIVNNISSTLFAVYVITENPFILGKLYKYLGIYTGQTIYGYNIILKMFLDSILVLILCIIIELIRLFIISFLKKLIQKIKK